MPFIKMDSLHNFQYFHFSLLLAAIRRWQKMEQWHSMMLRLVGSNRTTNGSSDNGGIEDSTSLVQAPELSKIQEKMDGPSRFPPLSMLQNFLIPSIKSKLKMLIMRICSTGMMRCIRQNKQASSRYFDFLLFDGLASSVTSGCASSLNSTSREREVTASFGVVAGKFLERAGAGCNNRHRPWFYPDRSSGPRA